MVLPPDVEEALCVCSLRFDGYRWLEAHRPGENLTDFRLYVDPIVDTLRLHSDDDLNFAACFALQRFLCKWGGEMLPPESREHVAWRYLFLHLYRQEVPVRFRHPEYAERWDREFAQTASAHAALVREALLVNGPGRDLPITLDSTRTLSGAAIEIASWSLASELVRRSPRRLRIVETHPGGGMSDCLTILSGSWSVSHINRVGSLHITRRVDGAPRESLMVDIWPRFAADESLRTILDEWCRHLGLTIPNPLPPGSRASLTYRVIAAFLKQSTFGPHTWKCVNGFNDTSGWGGGQRDEHFARFPEAEARRRVAVDDDVLQNPCYRFWFLEHDNEPTICLETNGTAWLADARRLDLNHEYRQHRNPNLLAAMLAS